MQEVGIVCIHDSNLYRKSNSYSSNSRYSNYLYKLSTQHACSDTDQLLQVPALLLVSATAVCLDIARENHQTATVIDCATSLKIAALMQSHCVR